MKKSLIITIICTVVSLSLIFFYNQTSTKPWTPVLHFIQRTNSNSPGHSMCLRDDEKEQREKRTNETDSKIWNGKGCENENKEKKQPQKTFATRKNLIILSPGRGGSSLLGSFFDSNPQVMYCFEPLYPITNKIFKVDLVRGEKEPKNYREACINVIDSFFQCDFSNFSHATLSAFSKSKFHLRKSKALSSKTYLPQFSSILLNKACNTYNHTVIKILSARVPNKTIQTLKELFQQQTQYDVKLVHLVRDPRAVFNSRVKLKWMKNESDPSFHKRVQEICDSILQNIRLGLLSPPPWLKNRFKVIRYEDLVVNTVNITRELYRFAGFDWSASVDKWISAQAKNTKQKGAYTLYRNVSAAMYGWKNAPKPFIKAVEDACSDLMDFLGYEKSIN